MLTLEFRERTLVLGTHILVLKWHFCFLAVEMEENQVSFFF